MAQSTTHSDLESRRLESMKLDKVRLAGSALSVGTMSMLLVGLKLAPSAAGHGTHTELGLPPCPWVISWNLPCPTCGMTTAVSYASHGDLVHSFETQPFGALIALAAAVMFWAGLHATLFGVRVWGTMAVLSKPRIVTTLVMLFLAAWGYKMITWR